jgi:transglutaminase-like putative cysteine protease
MAEPDFLAPTPFLDWQDPRVRRFTTDAVGSATEPIEKAGRIFRAVRGRIWYDPYSCSTESVDYRASHIALQSRAYCIPKAVLLTAAARAAGIPARLGFADVRNHLQTEALRNRMGGADLFVWHGYTEMLLEDRWVKATPAFNRELCARFGVEPLEFDGRHDALLHAPTADGSPHMEYVHDRGWFADLPLEQILRELRDNYRGVTTSATAPNDTFNQSHHHQPLDTPRNVRTT